MRDRNKEFLLSCRKLDFGKGNLSKKERTFYRRFNKEVLSLCRSLPESAQTDALLFLMQYSGLNLGDELDFFSNFYPPAWSILYWLSRADISHARTFLKSDLANAVTAQSLAMFIHSLDDHLTDGQVSVSPLTLLLRTRAWTIMERALLNLADGVPTGKKTVRRFLDHYYSSLQNRDGPNSFDKYCDLFRGQMALGMIGPVLLSMKHAPRTDFPKDLEMAYGCFGIAWRLLDDLRDIEEDIAGGAHSSVYYCLPKKMKALWGNHTRYSRSEAKFSINGTLEQILKSGLVERTQKRICTELDTAAFIVDAYNLKGLAREFRCLAHPLRKSDGLQEKPHGKPETALAPM